MVPVWMSFVLLGVAVLFLPRFRFLSAHLILSSTLGLVFSFGMSTMALILLPHATANRWIVLLGYLAGIGLGGLIGIVIGTLMANKLNKLISGKKYSNRGITEI